MRRHVVDRNLNSLYNRPLLLQSTNLRRSQLQFSIVFKLAIVRGSPAELFNRMNRGYFKRKDSDLDTPCRASLHLHMAS